MGNQQVKSLTKRKNYSFDTGQFNNFNMDKIMPSMMVRQNNAVSSLDLKSSNYIKSSSNYLRQSSSDLVMMPQIKKQNSQLISNKNIPKISIKQQNAKLQKLTKVNDQLRKQLIQINKKLSDQLQRKKMPILMANHQGKLSEKSDKQKNKSIDKQKNKSIDKQKTQKQRQRDKFKAIGLKKQLQNAYNQVSMYKKQIQLLKKGDSHQGDMKLQTFQDQAVSIDQDISNMQKSIQSMKQVVTKQQVAIKGYQQQLNGQDVKDSQKQIVNLKDRIKKIKQISRKKQKDQKMRHQLLIQMERKLRQINQQYVPQLKNYSLEEPQEKSRIINNKPSYQKSHKKIQKQKQFRYLPSKLELQQVQKQLENQKKSHQDFHKKIDSQLRKRNQYKQERSIIQIKLQSIYKNLQNLHYKKDRYMQLIMGNIALGGQGIDDMLSIGEQQILKQNDIVIKGQNLQGQVEFSDKKLIKNYDKIINKLKVVTVNIWTNQKGQIIAFQFYYTDGDSFFVGGKSAQINVVTEKSTLELSQGDYIRNVMGIFNSKTKFLQFIVFESMKGKVLKVGKQSFKNNNFNLRISKGQRPASISGACVYDGVCWRITRLDFLIKSS